MRPNLPLLPYGKNQLSWTLLDSISFDVLDCQISDRAPDRASIIQHALTAPIGTMPLRQLAKNKRTAVILISDKSRLCPSHIFLPDLLNELNRGGIQNDDITIVVALGLHRKQTVDELQELVGIEVWEREVTVVNHSSLSEDCVVLGTTSYGTPIEINRTVAEADLRIATGNMEPHRLAGLSGGVKALIPGVASQRTIEANHSLSQIHKSKLGNPHNVIRADLEEGARMLSVDFLFNVVVNHEKQLLAAAAGDPVKAHRSLSQFVSDRFLLPIQQRYPLVIASAGGYPKDMQLYQAVKALQNAADACAPNGTILLAAKCDEMYGNGTFQTWIETIQDRSKILEKLQSNFVIGAHKIEHIDHILQKHRVFMYTDMPQSAVELAGFQHVENFQETVDALSQACGGRVAVMPYGSLTFPIYESSRNEEDVKVGDGLE